MVEIEPGGEYTRTEVAGFLGMSLSELDAEVRSGEFPQPRYIPGKGNVHFWSGDALLEFVHGFLESRGSHPDLVIDTGVGNEPFDPLEPRDPEKARCTYRCCTRKPDTEHEWRYPLGMCEAHARKADELLSGSLKRP